LKGRELGLVQKVSRLLYQYTNENLGSKREFCRFMVSTVGMSEM
jgi:hypothetical protein